MGQGVFIHRADSIYDDNPAEQYQFPSQYLGRASSCIGDWIVYYEPVKVNDSRGYFAVARVQQIIPDPKSAGMYLALIEPGSYLDFSNAVPFSTDTGVTELGLLNAEGRISGRAQSAVRPLSPGDFERIASLGLDDPIPLLPRVDVTSNELGEQEQAPFEFETTRNRVEFLASRAVRDQIFRRNVLRAYDNRCAISGLKLINGGGRAEVEAAHIRPVQNHGPDSIRNGIALSGTAHWMFDRGLISLSDDMSILISRQVNDPDSVRAFVSSSGRARVPNIAHERPHPHFLAWHRQFCFKG